MTSCEHCGRTRPKRAKGKWTCLCTAVRDSQIKPHIVTQPVTSHDRQRQAWAKLHQFPVDNYDRWRPEGGQAEVIALLNAASEFNGCSCKDNFTKIMNNIPPNVLTAKSFAETGWKWHNAVNRKLGKPVFSWAEYEALYGHPWSKPARRVKLVTALSQLPKHMERQHICLDTWKEFGGEIWACNTAEEIAVLKAEYPQVDHWHAENELSEGYLYNTQKIRNLARLSHEIGSEIYLIHSDIELHGTTDAFKHKDGCQLLGIRWNYEPGSPRCSAKQFQWGIDMFSFTPEIADALPEDFPFAIGHAMWDYAVPYFTLKAGFGLQILHERCLFHEEHETNWSQDSWHFGADWIGRNSTIQIGEGKSGAIWRESLAMGGRYSPEHGMWLGKGGHRMPSDPLFMPEWREHYEALEKNQSS